MQTGGLKGAYKIRYSTDGLTSLVTKEGGVTVQPTLSGGSGAEEKKARYSNWGAGNMDPDSVARHHRSLNRGGWKNNSDAKGIF